MPVETIKIIINEVINEMTQTITIGIGIMLPVILTLVGLNFLIKYLNKSLTGE